MSFFKDVLGNINDYVNMPKYELQQRAIMGDAKAQRIYLERYGLGKLDTVTPKFAIEDGE